MFEPFTDYDYGRNNCFNFSLRDINNFTSKFHTGTFRLAFRPLILKQMKKDRTRQLPRRMKLNDIKPI